MTPSTRPLLRAALAVAACAAAVSARAQCAWPGPATTIEDEPLGFTRVWTGPLTPEMLAPAPPVAPGLTAYRDWAKGRTDTDGRALLRRQLELYRRIGVKDGALKLEEVLAGRSGRLERMNCLETLFFAEHEARFPVEATQTEFLAVVLQRGAEVKAYLISRKGDPGVGPGLRGVEPLLKADLAAGWTMTASLHNHPFMFDNAYGDIGGVLVPSGDGKGGDLSAFRRFTRDYGMREAWITNGFESLRLPVTDTDRLISLLGGD